MPSSQKPTTPVSPIKQSGSPHQSTATKGASSFGLSTSVSQYQEKSKQWTSMDRRQQLSALEDVVTALVLRCGKNMLVTAVNNVLRQIDPTITISVSETEHHPPISSNLVDRNDPALAPTLDLLATTSTIDPASAPTPDLLAATGTITPMMVPALNLLAPTNIIDAMPCPPLDSLIATHATETDTLDLGSVVLNPSLGTNVYRQPNPFVLNIGGTVRTRGAAYSKKCRSIKKIIKSVKDAGFNNAQRSRALHDALTHVEIVDISQRVGVLKRLRDFKSYNQMNFCFEQLRNICRAATMTNRLRGRTTDAKALFVESIFTGIVATDEAELRDPRRPGTKRLAKMFNLPRETMRKIYPAQGKKEWL